MPSERRWLGRANAGQEQKLGGADRAAADDDLVGVRSRPPSHSTPTQRVPSKSRRCAVAPVSSSRFGLPSIGRRYAAAVLWRTPFSMLYCMNDTPSCVAPL